jgi:hypothetical protein
MNADSNFVRRRGSGHHVAEEIVGVQSTVCPRICSLISDCKGTLLASLMSFYWLQTNETPTRVE